MKKYIQRGFFFIVAIALLNQGECRADDQSASIFFHGVLIKSISCSINDGGKVDVDFGNTVGVTEVDGINYRIPINYQINCTGTSSAKTGLTLTLVATPTSFDKLAVQSSIPDLGIRVYQGKGDTILAPGKAINIVANNPPALEAVPVKLSGSTLKEGAFEATATFELAVQ